MSRSFRFISTAAAVALLPAVFAYDRSEHVYSIPAVALTDQAGRSVRLDALLNGPRPVVLQFIFTTCSTVCPIMTATLRTARKDLGDALLVSISIDPEHDTPDRLAEYAARYQAGAGWLFLTGSAAGIASVQRAFDTLAPNKMTHRPLTFLRARGARSWIRLDGLSSAAELVREFRSAAASSADVQAGKRLYREGILEAIVAGDVPVTGERWSCAACHRRSGLGGVEGGSRVPPVTGDALFRPAGLVRSDRLATLFEEGQPLDLRTRLRSAQARPAYDLRTLGTALRQGVDPTGRALHAAMPRYRVDDRDLANLAAYLSTLGSAPPPGVDTATLRFATVVAEGVDPVDRTSLLSVMQAWIARQNREADYQARKGARVAWDREDAYATARRWELDVWELQGGPASWTRRLEELYDRQPVFAIVGGLVPGPWQPVADFCDKFEVPCLFPETDLPAASPDSGYTIYFSRGVLGEAAVLASHLRSAGRTLQVYSESPLFSAAAAAFLRGISYAVSAALLADWWRALLAGRHPQSLVSSTLPADDPSGERTRMKNWQLSRGIAPGNERIQLNAQFTLALLEDSLRRMAGRFSRDYLIETIERETETARNPGVYPRLTLGPGQRFASKRAWIVP